MTQPKWSRCLVAALVVVCLAATACGNDDGVSDDEAFREQIEYENQVAEQQIVAMNELLDMPDAECEQADAYSMLGIEYFDRASGRGQPQVAEDHSEFYFDCVTGLWDWRFPGDAAHVWHNPATSEQHGSQIDQELMPLEVTNPPLDHQHPAYIEAPTLRELLELADGQVICVHHALDPDLSPYPTQYRLHGIGSGPASSYGASTSAYAVDPVMKLLDASLNGSDISVFHSLENMGVIPHVDTGLWSRSYVTPGICQGDSAN
jgi:hypothetical protein